MGILNDLATFSAAPASFVDDGIAQRAEARSTEASDTYLKRAASVNRDLIKKTMYELAPSRRTGIPAHIAIWRYINSQIGDQTIQEAEPVTEGGAPLKEYRFIITETQMPKADRFTVMGTFGDDPDFAMSFGEEPHIWNFAGLLRNQTGRGAWLPAMETFYRERLRASRMIRRGEFARVRVGALRADGYFMDFNTSQSSQNDDAVARFSFRMYVRQYRYDGGEGAFASLSSLDEAQETDATPDDFNDAAFSSSTSSQVLT